jgi:hypothetical protein
MDWPGVAGYIRQSMHLELRSEGPPRRRARPAASSLPALLLAILLLAPLLFTPAGAVLAQTSGFESAEVIDSRDRVLADSRYQTEMPEPEARPERALFTIPPWLAEIIFWVLIAAVLAMVAYFLFQLAYDLLRDRSPFQRNRDRSGAAPERVETPMAAAPREVDPRSLAEADRLAAEGRFSEAIHLLLLVALQRLHRELGARVAPALTGREVLHLPSLPGATVAPLTRMVRLSEINHFGGRTAREPDYRSARDDYLAFSGEAPVTT